MRTMSTGYEEYGRAAQKGRTRAAVVSAARELVAAGHTPTVEEAAAAARVSRSTAYRYFPTQTALLGAAHPETSTTSLLGPHPPLEVSARLDTVVTGFIELILETEDQQRTMLRLSLEADPVARAALPLRQGRAIGWIGEALAPLRGRLTEPELHHLVLAIRTTVGIEALAWLSDVARLPRAEAVELMRWSAQALLHAAVSAAPPRPAVHDGTEADAVDGGAS